MPTTIPESYTTHRGAVIHEPIINYWTGQHEGRWAHRLHAEALPAWAWVLIGALTVLSGPASVWLP